MFNCKYCNKEFETSLKLGGHISRCSLNPNYKLTIKKVSEANTLYKNIYVCNCVICNNEYTIKCTDNIFKKGQFKKTCSDSCAKKLTSLHTNKEDKNNKLFEIFKEKFNNNYSNKAEKIKYDKEKKHILNINNKRLSEKYKQYNFRLINEYECDKCGNINCSSNICKLWSFNKILTLIKYFNFNPDALGTNLFFDELNRIKLDLEFLYNNFGSYGIFEKYGYPEKHIGNILKYFNIKRRTISEAVIFNWKLGKLGNNVNETKYKTENHITWDNKTYFLRSSYETDYANLLDNNKIVYEVESKRIEYFDTLKNKNRVAVPDFYLPDTNTIVEIKSTWTLNIQEMKDKFNEYNKLGYNTKLILEHKEVDIKQL